MMKTIAFVQTFYWLFSLIIRLKLNFNFGSRQLTVQSNTKP